jgi:peptidyl-prolyl cis-trans isomerase C
MKKRVLIVALMILLAACAFAAEQTKQNIDSTRVLAKVAGKPIIGGELDSIATALRITITDTTNLPSLKQNLLDSLIEQRLINIRVDSVKVVMAKDRGEREKRTNQVADVVFKAMYDNEISYKITIDSAEIDSFYVQNPPQFTTPEEIKAAHILIAFPKPDTAGIKLEKDRNKIIEKGQKETLRRAKEVFNKAKSVENWDTLVAKYSEDKTHMKNGGDLGTFARGKMQPEFDTVAFAAPAGKIVGPVKTRFGYDIIRVDQHIPSGIKPLDKDLRNSIKAGVFRNKETASANKFVDSLKALATYKFNEEALAKPDSEVDINTWLVIVNDQDTVFENKVKEYLPKYIRYKKITEVTPEVKKDMLKDMSTGSLLLSAGKKLGYYDKPEAVQAGIDFDNREARAKVTEMMRDLAYKPSPEEIKTFFDDHFAERYKEQRPLHIQHIIFTDSASAIIVRDSILAGADFKEMALRHYPGEKEIREVAYDLGYISDKDMGEQFYRAADSLKVGEISLPVKTQWGYHLIKLVDRRSDKTLDQVRPGIIKELTDNADNKVRRKLLTQWRTQAKINVLKFAVKAYKFPEQLKAIQIANPPAPGDTLR